MHQINTISVHFLADCEAIGKVKLFPDRINKISRHEDVEV
jgi:hypothetical protein